MSPIHVKNRRDQHSRLDIAIAVDASGSMALPFSKDRPMSTNDTMVDVSSKKEWLCEALSEVISQLGESDRLGIVCYNNDAEIIHRLSEKRTCEVDELLTSLMNYGVYGGTNLCSGIEKAVEVFGPECESNRSKRILFVSDSIPSAIPDQSPFINRLRGVSERDITITFVGLDTNPSEEFSRSLSKIDHVTHYYINSTTGSIYM